MRSGAKRRGEWTSADFLEAVARTPRRAFALGVLTVVLMLPAMANAAFPGANGQIVAAREGPLFGFNAALVGTDGQVSITSGVTDGTRPAWSPDGSMLMNGVSYSGRGLVGIPLPSVPPGGGGPFEYFGFAFWAPTDRALAYRYQHGDVQGWYLGFFDGRPAQRLAVQAPLERWSPDGRFIAGYADTSDQDRPIALYPAAGGSPRLLGVSGSHVDWSPDSSHVTYSRAGDIYVIDALTRHRERALTRSGDNRNPVWSPDGRTIAFVSSRSGHDDIYTMRDHGGQERRLTNTPPYVYTDADGNPVSQVYPHYAGLDWQAVGR
jgi:hypothetical protein